MDSLAGVQKVCLLCDAQFIGEAEHSIDQVIHRHQRTPSVLKRTVNAGRSLVIKHVLIGNSRVVLGSRFERDIPRRWSGGRAGPTRIPIISVPWRGLERIVGGLRFR